MGKGGEKGEESGECKPQVRSYTWEEIQKHNLRTDRWLVIERKVYNVTQWASRHPGGQRVIGHCAGEDATVRARGRSGIRRSPAGRALPPLSPHISPHTADTRGRSASPAGQHAGERSGEAPLRGFVCVRAVPGVGDSWAGGLPLLRARLRACRGARTGRVKARPPFHCRSVAGGSRTRRRSAFSQERIPQRAVVQVSTGGGVGWGKKSLPLLQLLLGSTAGLFPTPLLFRQLKKKKAEWVGPNRFRDCRLSFAPKPPRAETHPKSTFPARGG